MKQYQFLLHHISTLSTLPQCLCMASAIARRSSELSVVQTGLLLQSLAMKEDDIKIAKQQQLVMSKRSEVIKNSLFEKIVVQAGCYN